MKKLLSIVAFIGLSLTLLAGTVNLAWNASTSPEVNRYKIYYAPGTNFVFTANNSNATGSVIVPSTQLTASVSNLVAGAWSFTATALSTNNLESADSNVAWTFVSLAGVANLTITGTTP
jgi:hypothetical protein